MLAGRWIALLLNSITKESVMRWQGRRASSNVEDQRASGPRRVALGGGLGGIVIVVVLILFGADPKRVLQMMVAEGPPGQRQQANTGAPPADDELAEMVSVVLADTEDVWNQLFGEMGQQYREPKLILFRDSVPRLAVFKTPPSGRSIARWMNESTST